MQEDQNNQPIDGPEREVEAALAALRPSVPTIDRDRLLFSAGYRSAQHRLWLWRGMTASLAAMLLLSILVRPELPTNQPSRSGGGSGQLVGTTNPSRPTQAPLERVKTGWVEMVWSMGNQTPPQSPGENYLSVRQAVLQGGVSALPAAATDPTTAENLPLFELRLKDKSNQLPIRRQGGEAL